MDIEKKNFIDQLNLICKNTLMQTLEIQYIEAGEDYLIAKMPVNPKVHQPMGLLHGGASVALAESVGSAASLMLVNTEKQEVRGIEIAANHVKSKRNGVVTAIAKLQHQGKSLHLWEIKILDENHQLISICKLTNMVLPKRIK